MSDEPTPAAPTLTQQIASTTKGFDVLEQVLDTLFAAYEKQGIKPTYHLTAARDKMRTNLSDAQVAARHSERQIAQLGQVVRTGTLLTSSLELDTVLDDVMDTVIELTGAERVYLMLYDEGKTLQTRAARNWEREKIKDADALFSQGIVDAAIAQGTPIITTNAQSDERFAERASIMMQQLRSIICIPLTMRGSTVGVLYADNRYKQDLFTEDMVPLLTAFGSQAAVAISNAQRFGEVKNDLAEAQAAIHNLLIAIDQKRVDTQVGEITGSEYFQKLSEAAKAKRVERQTGEQEAISDQEVKREKDKKK
jgi:transcriptional regulator with GAF, ATPase, and Fis domain